MAAADEYRRRARSFDAAAAQYARYRPSYPGPALDWLLPAGAHRVLDLAAGTGKLTATLADRHLDVVAVEPLPGMRAHLAATAPDADIRDGTAEDIPLPDADVDAVLVAQAWHWFDQDRALPEIARVLRPGGTLGVLWNREDLSVDWVHQIEELAYGAAPREVIQANPFGPHAAFDPAEAARFHHGQDHDTASLTGLYGSHSPLIVEPEPSRSRRLARIGAAVRTHPDLAGRDRFTLPYLTLCWRARRTV